MTLRGLSLRARLLLGVVVLAAVGLVVADVATYTSLRSFLLHRVDQSLEAGHPQVEQTAFPRLEQRPGPARGPGPPAQGVDWYQVRTLDGKALRGGFLIQGGSPPRLPATIAIPARATAPDGERATYFTAPARSGGGRYRVRASIELQHSSRVLVIATSLSSVDGTLHRLLVIELLVTGGVLVAIGGLGLWAVRVGLRPLRAIETTAAGIAAGDLTRRVERAEERTEVGRLGLALNAMLAQIESAFRAREASESKLRRFVADASHELRTPLSAVRAYAELFTRGAAERPDDLARAMSGIGREAERMSLLVEDLLLLARLDEGRPLEQEPVELAEVVAEAVDAARVVEPERPFAVELEPVTVTGDRDRLRQIVDNLLANVRAHTPAGTPVRVVVRRVDGSAEIGVTDSGPGLTEEQAAQVFERFYRADDSRARAVGGAGLGLSIVAAVARAHGGEVSARSSPGGGATFLIALPLSGGEPASPRD
ncbi:MAG TPA: HAMP domain-containing sensor histidine kinase [Gaiellaceae bacterium]|nr:HAMP domain-containing sensor histidine kinase [Gaiellaceae bacterium]